MKKLTTISYSILGFLVLCLIFGCLDGKPASWKLEDGNWEFWMEGKIIALEKIEENSIDYIKITFDDGHSITMGAIKDFGKIRVDSTGKLYKHNLNNDDNISWFQWIENKEKIDIKEVEEVVIEKEPVKEEKVTTIDSVVKKESWNNGDDIEDLKAKDLVLIKLDDGIITTGFVTYDRQWKLGTNINKYQYGMTVYNVYKWKRVDLED